MKKSAKITIIASIVVAVIISALAVVVHTRQSAIEVTEHANETISQKVNEAVNAISKLNQTNSEATLESICKTNGGSWVEQYKECWRVLKQTCNALNGTFYECGGCDVHPTNPTQVCPAMCIPFCRVK